MNKLNIIISIISLTLLHNTYADEAAAAESKPKKPECGDILISGYVDGSYNYLLRNNQFISGVNDRLYDLAMNGFTLQQSGLTLAYQPAEGFGGLVNVLLGRDAFHSAPFGYNPNIGSNYVGFAVMQLYGQYAHEPFTLLLGNFNSLAGIETTDTTQNANFSASFINAYSEPATVLGTRLNYTLNPKAKFSVGVNNGWDDIRDTTRGKSIELSMILTPNDDLSITVDGLSGQQRALDPSAVGPIGTRNLFDIFGTYKVNKHLTLAANYDYCSQNNVFLSNISVNKAIWQGITGYFNYEFNDIWRFSLRGEYFNDNNGYRTGVKQELKEITLSIGYVLLKKIHFTAEVRKDKSNALSYVKRDGFTLSDFQQSYSLSAFYSFSNKGEK